MIMLSHHTSDHILIGYNTPLLSYKKLHHSWIKPQLSRAHSTNKDKHLQKIYKENGFSSASLNNDKKFSSAYLVFEKVI